MYSVVNVMNSDGMRNFLDVPRHVYWRDPHYVDELRFDVRRQLDVTRNPFFRSHELSLMVCLKNSIPVARASLVWRKNDMVLPKRAMFGYFECIHDDSAFLALMTHLEEMCMKHGITSIEGPFSPHYYGVTGIQTEGFGIGPTFLEPYSPQYYAELFLKSGFSISQTGRTWHRWSREVPQDSHAGIETGCNGYRLRSVSSLSSREIQRIAKVIEPAFRDNWRSFPVSFEEYSYTARGLALAFRPGLVNIVEHDNNPIGALILLLDINQALRGKHPRGRLRTWFHLRRSRINSFVVYAMGVVPEHRHSRAGLLLASRFEQIVAGAKSISGTWIRRENKASELMAERFGFRPLKTFAVFEKNIRL